MSIPAEHPVLYFTHYSLPRLYPVKSVDVKYRDAECRGSLVLVVVGDVDPDQDAGAPLLVTVPGRELDHQPPLSPGLIQHRIHSN